MIPQEKIEQAAVSDIAAIELIEKYVEYLKQ